MKVLITGATGLIGKEIVRYCHAYNIAVHYLSTSKNKLQNTPNYKGFYWNPKLKSIDAACFEGVDAIINLAGATIAKRWTVAYRNEIIESRILALQLLKETLSTTNHSVKHIISASAIGIYPDSQTNYYKETNCDVSKSFLGDVVKAWEDAVYAFTPLGLKVSKIRIGLVLAKNEGALPQIVKPVRYGFGAAFGDGKQWQSWIHVSDLARLFLYVMQNQLDGVYNAVAPNPVTNTELTKAIARTLKRPLWLPNIPRFFMHLFLGDMHMLLFESQ
ncbi:MAG TPA: TIGR01777 family oxidoreductase, partial [Flavobacteriaceae bacterium]|nr:TIGR01777 family oxidoreductase [Flavobacteriaceae bacterium]